jgi:hypothetical protein
MADRIVALATELRTRLIAAHPPLEKRLRPGLAPEQAREIAASHGVTLTDEALAYFSVLNGFDNPHAQPQSEHIVGMRWLDSLEEALKHYQRFWEFDETDVDTYPEFWENDPMPTPPLRFIGEDSVYFYALDLRGEGRPVWSMDRESGISVRFVSLEAMLTTINAWLAEGVLIFRDGEWGETSHEQARRIASQLNPDVGYWHERDEPQDTTVPPALDFTDADIPALEQDFLEQFLETRPTTPREQLQAEAAQLARQMVALSKRQQGG